MGVFQPQIANIFFNGGKYSKIIAFRLHLYISNELLQK